MDTITEIINTIKSTKYAAIVCHYHPDGDTLGSAFSLHRILNKQNINSDVLCEDKIPTDFKFLFKAEVLTYFDKSKYDLIIFVDCASRSMSDGILKDISINQYKTINIDHHGTNELYADINYVDDKSSSTAELILGIIKKMHVVVDKTTAEYLYTSIITDTGQFAYSYTSAKTHENAAYLINCGADTVMLHNAIFKNTSLKKILLQKRMLDNIKIFFNNKIVSSRLEKNDFETSGATHEDVNSLVNILFSIENTKIAILIRELENKKSKISLRSTRDIDLTQLSQLFGGGGHKQACGATINLNTIEAETIIIKAIKDLDILK